MCQESLSVARLPVSAFDRVILVGGSTRIPLVRRRVEQFFGAPPLDRVNPEEVVAIGAAIQAAALTEVARRRSIPPPPARKSSPSRPADDESDEDVTVAAPLASLVAEQERAAAARQRLPSQPPEVPRTTARLAPPPLPPTSTVRTARMSVPDVSKAPAITQPLPTPHEPDPAATIPRPLVFDDVLRAERESAETTQPKTPLTSTQPMRAVPTAPLPVVPVPVRASPPPDAPPPDFAHAVISPSPRTAPMMAAPAMPSPAAAIAPPRPPSGRTMAAPVLVDVTPLSLVVETVGGWCDVIVQRNAKIPCERSRAFATSSDMQTVVRVRVAQGQDPTFGQNTYLGEVELSGLRPAPRGEVTIQVRFEVDESGTLKVSATDVATGREAKATLQLIGIAGAGSIAAMQARQAAMRLQ